MAMPKLEPTLREMVRTLLRAGWTLQNGSRHIKLLSSSGRLVACFSRGRQINRHPHTKEISNIRRAAADEGITI